MHLLLLAPGFICIQSEHTIILKVPNILHLLVVTTCESGDLEHATDLSMIGGRAKRSFDGELLLFFLPDYSFLKAYILMALGPEGKDSDRGHKSGLLNLLLELLVGGKQLEEVESVSSLGFFIEDELAPPSLEEVSALVKRHSH